MSDTDEPLERSSRPSLDQLKAIVKVIESQPNINTPGFDKEKHKELWEQVTEIANSLDGAKKTDKGWAKFWADKKRSVKMKQRQIKDGTADENLLAIEKRILNLCADGRGRKRKAVKQEPCNGNDSASLNEEESLSYIKEQEQLHKAEQRLIKDIDEKQVDIMEKMVDAMTHQASAMTQMAQATLSNSKALERLAEASHIQALAVDRLATTFENISGSVVETRNAIISIDYTMKQCYSTTGSQQQHRQNNLFS